MEGAEEILLWVRTTWIKRPTICGSGLWLVVRIVSVRVVVWSGGGKFQFRGEKRIIKGAAEVRSFAARFLFGAKFRCTPFFFSPLACFGRLHVIELGLRSCFSSRFPLRQRCSVMVDNSQASDRRRCTIMSPHDDV